MPGDLGGGGTALFPTWKTGPRLGSRGVLEAYATMPWLRSLVQKVSEDVACLTWRVYVPVDKHGMAVRDKRIQRSMRYRDRQSLLKTYEDQGQLRELTDHPLVDFLCGGSDFFSGMVSLQVTQSHLDLVGETAWIIEPNEFGMPVAGVPIPPTWIMNTPRETGGFYRVVGPGATWEIPKNRMFYAYHPDMANPFGRGTGISQVLADELETDEFAAKHTKDWFRNRAIPPVLISGLGVNVNELQRLEEKWLAKFTRRGAGWLPHFLGSKVDVHQLSQSFQQQELGALRDRERDMIREVFGVPPEIMGHVANSNRSTIDASDFIYQSRVIVPRAEFLRSSAQMSIVPLFDDRLILDYVSPVAEDREFALKVRQAAPWAWSADEWRDLGLTQPLPEGKGAVHAVPFSIVFSNQFAATPEPGPALPARAQRMVTRASADDAIDAIVNAVEFEVLESAGLPVIRAAIAHFGQSTVETALAGTGIDFQFDLRDPAVEDHLRTWGAQRMGEDVSETTKAAIRESLAEGLEEGETFDELVDRIGSVFDVEDGRLESIVTTELNRSSNFAAELGLKQAGFSDKEWLATKDDHVRDTHAALDGTIVGIDEDFVSASGASGPYPGELGEADEDIGCRCAVITVLAERSLEAKTAQWKTLQSEKAPYEKRLRASLSKAFDAQEAAVIAALKESGVGAKSSRMAKPKVLPAVPVRSESMPINVHVEPSAVTVNLPAPIIHVPAPVVNVESPTVTLSAPAVHVPVTVSSGRQDPEVVKVPARRRRVERDADNRIVALIDEPMDVALPLETGELGKER